VKPSWIRTAAGLSAVFFFIACGDDEPEDGVGPGQRLTINQAELFAGDLRGRGGDIVLLGFIEGNLTLSDGSGLTARPGARILGNLNLRGRSRASIEGVRVEGNVEVREDAVLLLENTEVTGNIEATGASDVDVTDASDVGGNLTIEGCDQADIETSMFGGDVRIEGCDLVNVLGNTIEGDFVVRGNATCTVTSNQAGSEDIEGC